MFVPKHATVGRGRLTKGGQITGLKGRLDLTGDKELLALLAKLPDNVYRRVIKKASAKAIKPVLASARAKAPSETGLLKQSLGEKQKEYRRAGVTVTLVGPRKGFKRLVKVFDSNGNVKDEYRNPAAYAHLVEFGTGPHSTVSGTDTRSKKLLIKAATLISEKNHPGTAPQPFMRPAYDENRSRMVAIIHAEIGAGVIAEARKLAT